MFINSLVEFPTSKRRGGKSTISSSRISIWPVCALSGVLTVAFWVVPGPETLRAISIRLVEVDAVSFAFFAFFWYERQLASVWDALLQLQPEHAEKTAIEPKGTRQTTKEIVGGANRRLEFQKKAISFSSARRRLSTAFAR